MPSVCCLASSRLTFEDENFLYLGRTGWDNGNGIMIDGKRLHTTYKNVNIVGDSLYSA